MELEIIPVTDTPNKFIIYRPRLGMAFAANRVMAELARHLADDTLHIENVQPDIANFLHAVGFFTPDPSEPPLPDRVYRPTIAVLLMTNQCQLRCTYCYAAAGTAPRQQLTFEVGQAAIDHVCDNAMQLGLPRFDVSIHGGGEPTFAWTVLKACVEYARQKPIQANITLTSNGVWSPTQRDWIIQNFDGVSLSVDGGPATQDLHRPFVSGAGSSAIVMQTIAELDRHNFPYGIRLTATSPWDRLPEDIRFLCENTACHSIQVEPAFNTQRGGHGAITEEEGGGFVRAYLAAYDIATSLNRRMIHSGARLGTVTATFCSAPFNALIVAGDGSLVTCYEVTDATHPLASISRIGHIENGAIEVESAARDHLHHLMAERRDDCRDCFCYWSCAGDCYVRSFKNTPEGHQARSYRCDMNRQLTEQLLLRDIALSGGVRRATIPQPAPFSGMSSEGSWDA